MNFFKKLRRSLYRRLPTRWEWAYELNRRGHKLDIPKLDGFQAQHGQDLLLTEVLFAGVTEGFFVDIGAFDGITLSNAYRLEKSLDWQGICVEPQPQAYSSLSRERNARCLNCCVSDHEGTTGFLHVEDAPMLSGIPDRMDQEHQARLERGEESDRSNQKIITVECLPFAQLFTTKPDRIDYLSIDVEGAELPILRAIDFADVRIRLISVENTYGDFAIAKHLFEQGYRLIAVVGDDEFYAGHDFPTRPWQELREAVYQAIAHAQG